MNMNAPLATFDTKSALHLAIAAVFDGHRVATQDAAKTLQAVVTKCESAKAGGAELAETFLRLPVAIAGAGSFEVAAIIAGDVALPPLGDLGHIISLIGVRGIVTPSVDEAGKPTTEKRNGAIGLAIYPAHSVAAFLTTDEGKEHVEAVLAKESGLQAFRRLRFTPAESTLQDMADAAKGMPVAISDYTDRQRGKAADAYAVFTDNWSRYLSNMRANPAQAPLAAVLPVAAKEMLSAIRSKAFAVAKYPALESAGWFTKVARHLQGVLVATQQAVETAIESGEEVEPFDYDLTAFDRWLEKRDELDLFNRIDSIDADLSNVDLFAMGSAA